MWNKIWFQNIFLPHIFLNSLIKTFFYPRFFDFTQIKEIIKLLQSLYDVTQIPIFSHHTRSTIFSSKNKTRYISATKKYLFVFLSWLQFFSNALASFWIVLLMNGNCSINERLIIFYYFIHLCTSRHVLKLF